MILSTLVIGCQPHENVVGEIAQNMWWKKPLTTKQVDELVSKLCEINSGDCLIIQHDATYEVQQYIFVAELPYRTYEMRIRVDHFDARPTREQAAKYLLSVVREVEHRDGPAKERKSKRAA
jgi:hypothetical protein